MRTLALGVLLFAACGGTGSGGGGVAITEAEAEPLCRSGCEHEMACDPLRDVEICTTDCISDMAGWARIDAVEVLVACRLALPCGENDDSCLLEIQPLAIHQAWEDKCRTTMATCVTDAAQLDSACEVSPDPANEDAGLFRMIAPAIMTELIACLDGVDCTARINCVNATLETHGINF